VDVAPKGTGYAVRFDNLTNVTINLFQLLRGVFRQNGV
jgi:hypothetical protein